MEAAFVGFATIWLIVAVGWLLAHVRLVTAERQRFMNSLAFLVAGPALMFTLLRGASLERVFSRTLLVSALAILATGALYVVLNRSWFRTPRGPTLIGTLASCYTNAGNIGLPLAAVLLGDMAWMPPIIVLQVAILQPLALAFLDGERFAVEGQRFRASRYLVIPLRNPLTVGIVAGLLANVTGWQVPPVLATPVGMVGSMMVPLMLLAFGASLRLNPLPGGGPHRVQTWVAAVLKTLVHPLIAYCLARYALLLGPHETYAVTVIAALPTAQNIFTIANRYRVAELLARDAVFWTTILTVPTILAITALIGA